LQRTTRSEHGPSVAGVDGALSTGTETEGVGSSTGTEVGAGSLWRLLSCGLLLCRNLRPSELLENVLRCLGRGISLIDAAVEAAVDTEALELVEHVRSRHPKDASDDADDTVESTLSRFDLEP